MENPSNSGRYHSDLGQADTQHELMVSAAYEVGVSGMEHHGCRQGLDIVEEGSFLLADKTVFTLVAETVLRRKGLFALDFIRFLTQGSL